MSKAAVTEMLFIDGPSGRLEAILETPGELNGCAVVCHPHPQHGGTMHNKVAHTLSRAFVRSGFETLRFNFRGTEGSEGEYDEGNGELDDALAAMTPAISDIVGRVGSDRIKTALSILRELREEMEKG